MRSDARPLPDVRRATRRMAALAFASALVLPAAVGLRVDLPSFALFAGLAAPLLPALVLLRWRRREALADAVETFLLALTLSVPVLIVSYCAMRLGIPLADGRLAAADAALGFDAPALVRRAGRSAWLSSALASAYSSFGPQLILLPPLLAVLGHRERAFACVGGYTGLCLVSIGLGAFAPALGTFQHHGLDAAGLGAVTPFFGQHFLASFEAVRTRPDFVLSLGVASGVVTFPSIHAGVAALCAWAAWPSRLLRTPVALLNAAMLASAVTHGAHYGVDVLAGLLVAAATIAMVSPSARRAPRLSARPAAPAGAVAARSA